MWTTLHIQHVFIAKVLCLLDQVYLMSLFISSNLQRRPSIFNEFFMLGRIIKIFISSILQGRPSIFKEFFFLLGRVKKDTYFFKSAKFSMLGRKIKIFFSSNLPSCLGHFL